jgi:hypothetical protein
MLLRTPDELGFDPNQVTPGWIGFTATALIGAVIILLMLDFNRRVRRINNRAEAKERIEAELAARDAADSSAEPLLVERAEGAVERDAAAEADPVQGDPGRTGA